MNHCPVYLRRGGLLMVGYPGRWARCLTPSCGSRQGRTSAQCHLSAGAAGALPGRGFPFARRLCDTARERESRSAIFAATLRAGLSFWGYFAKRPRPPTASPPPLPWARSAGSDAFERASARAASRRLPPMPARLDAIFSVDFPSHRARTFQERWRREQDRERKEAALMAGACEISHYDPPFRLGVRGGRAHGGWAWSWTASPMRRKALIPHRGQSSGRSAQPALFAEQAERACSASVARVTDRVARVPEAHSAAYLAITQSLMQELRMAADPRLRAECPRGRPQALAEARCRDGSDANCRQPRTMAHRRAGTPVDGLGAPDQPVHLNLLPDNSLVVVRLPPGSKAITRPCGTPARHLRQTCDAVHGKLHPGPSAAPADIDRPCYLRARTETRPGAYSFVVGEPGCGIAHGLSRGRPGSRG